MSQIIKPSWIPKCPFRKLLLSWRTGEGKRRHIVGEITISDDGQVSFSYSDNLDKANQEGFKSYPGLPLNKTFEQATAIDLFLRRLINTEREDALKKLSFWGVSEKDLDNKLYLLGITQGRTTSDEFEFLPVLQQKGEAYEFVTDIAGLRYFDIDISTLSNGERLCLKSEPSNEYDDKAVAVYRYNDSKAIGYLKQGINQLFAYLGTAEAEVIRIINTEHIKQVFISCKIPASV